MRLISRSAEDSDRKGQSIVEYVIVIALVAAVVAAALITLGESKEDYISQQETIEDAAEIEQNE